MSVRESELAGAVLPGYGAALPYQSARASGARKAVTVVFFAR
jgi:hypothetical protein